MARDVDWGADVLHKDESKVERAHGPHRHHDVQDEEKVILKVLDAPSKQVPPMRARARVNCRSAYRDEANDHEKRHGNAGPCRTA